MVLLCEFLCCWEREFERPLMLSCLIKSSFCELLGDDTLIINLKI